ncbi:DUF1360 domain-containing protein [Brevundimonas sp.]|uniref:DUF1360 domain-containing protein n=1 Tax=Brevundimonas sp. TaxID=1871086 RepID=UPI002896387E|nr:DUF1360 domain-containing protein [Brevundimonas sp.]
MTEILTSPAAHGLWICLVLAIASASVSITLTQTELFAPLRAAANKVGHMIGHLFHCFYCISHWVVIAGIAVYRPVIISSGVPVIDWTVSAFFTIALTALFCGMIFKVFLAAMSKKATEHELKKTLAQS